MIIKTLKLKRCHVVNFSGPFNFNAYFCSIGIIIFINFFSLSFKSKFPSNFPSSSTHNLRCSSNRKRKRKISLARKKMKKRKCKSRRCFVVLSSLSYLDYKHYGERQRPDVQQVHDDFWADLSCVYLCVGKVLKVCKVFRVCMKREMSWGQVLSL